MSRHLSFTLTNPLTRGLLHVIWLLVVKKLVIFLTSVLNDSNQKICWRKPLLSAVVSYSSTIVVPQWAEIRKKVQFREAELFASKAKIYVCTYMENFFSNRAEK